MQNLTTLLQISEARIGCIAADLQYPLFGWMFRDAADGHTPCLQMDEESDVICGEAAPSEHFNCEEICACENGHMRGNEVLPRRALASFRRRCNAVAPKNVAYSLVGNNMAEIRQCSNDAIITPAGILFCHLENQVGDFPADPRPTRVRTES